MCRRGENDDRQGGLVDGSIGSNRRYRDGRPSEIGRAAVAACGGIGRLETFGAHRSDTDFDAARACIAPT